MKTTIKTLLVITIVSYVGMILGLDGVQAQALDPDLNDDGVVSGRDVSIVAKCLNNKKGKKVGCEGADVDGDGDVDTDDLHLITDAIGQTGFPVIPTDDRITAEENGQKVVKDEIVVILDFETSDPEARIEKIAASSGGVVIGAIRETLTYQIQYDVPDLAALEAIRLLLEPLPDVVSANFHYIMNEPLAAIPNDAQYGGASNWDEDNPLGNNGNLELIQAPSAWDINTGDPSLAVAVIDGDIDGQHVDLSNNVVSSSGPRFPVQYKGHGTHVAGTICAEGNNGQGVTGVAWDCSLQLYNFGFSPVQAQQAMINAANAEARVVNMSLQWVENNQCGTPGTNISLQQVTQTNNILKQAIEAATRNNKDVLWVFAAGNECRDAQFASPASLTQEFLDNTMAVASVDLTPGVTSFANLNSLSNFGSLVTVAAPGSNILSTLPGNGYGLSSGTSMAAPHVSGLAALILSEHPNFSASDVKECIVDAANSFGASVPGHGFKVINAPEAITCASTPPGCVDPPLNLVSWWPGDGDSTDLVETNDGALRNGATFAAGFVEQAFDLDGVNDIIVVDHNDNLEFGENQNFTIEAWVNLQNPTAGFDDEIVAKFLVQNARRNPTYSYYRLLSQRDTHKVRLDIKSGSARFLLESNSPLNLDEWTYVTAVREGSAGRIYLNGVLDASATMTAGTLANGDPLTIGGIIDPQNPDFFNFGGLIDEVGIYNRALSAQEIQDIFNAGSAGKCKEMGGNTLSFSPDPVAFGAVDTGDAATIDLTVMNNSDSSVSCSVALADETPPGSSVFDVSPSSLNIPGPGSVITTVFFTPRRIGTFTIQIKFICNGGGLENFQKIVDVSGAGVEPTGG